MHFEDAHQENHVFADQFGALDLVLPPAIGSSEPFETAPVKKVSVKKPAAKKSNRIKKVQTTPAKPDPPAPKPALRQPRWTAKLVEEVVFEGAVRYVIPAGAVVATTGKAAGSAILFPATRKVMFRIYFRRPLGEERLSEPLTVDGILRIGCDRTTGRLMSVSLKQRDVEPQYLLVLLKELGKNPPGTVYHKFVPYGHILVGWLPEPAQG
jgi:hypothetical protein